MYLYEYGDLDLEERPRQIYPYAVVQFGHTGEQQIYRRPAQPASKTRFVRSIHHVTASMATRKRITNLGRRVNLESFNIQVPCF